MFKYKDFLIQKGFFMKTKILKGVFGFLLGVSSFLALATATLFNYSGIVNNALQIQTSKIVEKPGGSTTDTAYFKSDYVDSKLLAKNVNDLTASERTTIQNALNELIADEDEYVVYEMENSAVLLRNNNGALPLKASERNVNLFGVTSKQPLFSCASGGGKNDKAREVNFLKAFQDGGFNVNETLYDAYPEPGTKTSFGGVMLLRASDEPPIDETFTPAVENSIQQTGGVGIIFLAREGGEGDDIKHFITETDGTVRSGLALSNNEKALLSKAAGYKVAGILSKLIVVHNSPYTMELDWLDQYGIDAALHVGTIGLRGSIGLVNLLKGDANPSGHLADTFATNSLSAPAINTWYDKQFANTTTSDGNFYLHDLKVANKGAQKYMILTEGIYVGYKYYETRYEDAVYGRYGATSSVGSLDNQNWDYAKEVVFPFGYGLSYTTFKQELQSVSNVSSENIQVKVKVTNIGTVAGRSAVQVYAQTPYGENEIAHRVEKSAVTIVGMGKTDILNPNESEIVSVDVDRYLLTAYDNKSNNGEGGYILSAGDYYLAIGNNAHDALNNILAKKGKTNLIDETGAAVIGNADKVYKWTGAYDDASYRYSRETGVRVKNQFDEIDINNWIDNSITYLTRSNWSETFPSATPPDITATMEMAEILAYTYTKDSNDPGFNADEFGVDVGLKFVHMKDVPWEDEITWNKFLHQLTLEDLKVSISDRFSNAEITYIGKPANINDDGPDGWNQKYFINGAQATCYIGQAIAACSYDIEMFEKRAYFLAEDALFCKLSQCWAPGGNLHRTPFSGRNHEYFSEDANVNYLYLGREVKVLEDKGVSAGGKHFAGNDVELNRSNLCTFQTEQTWRQNSLRGFESSVTIGHATSLMNCKGGIGLRNISEDYASQVEVLRNEWGFKGVVIADAGSGRGPEGILGGTDMWCLFGGRYATAILDSITTNNDSKLLEATLLANKRFYYAYSRSNLINGLSSDVEIVSVTPWWSPTIISIDCVVGAATIGVGVLYVLRLLKRKEE